MTGGAALRREDRLARGGGGNDVPLLARYGRRRRSSELTVCSQRIEILHSRRLSGSSASGCACRVELRVGHQARAAGQPANLTFEVLNLIEVRAPVQGSPVDAGASAQVDRVAKAFTKTGEVPRGRRDRRRCGTTHNSCMLLSRESADPPRHRTTACLRAASHQLLRRNRRHQSSSARWPRETRRQQLRQVERAHHAAHEVVHEQRATVGREHEAPAVREAHPVAEQLLTTRRIDHRNLPVAFERDEQIGARRMVDRRVRNAREVEVEPSVEVFKARRQIDSVS